MTRPADPNASMRWMVRGIAAGVLVIGWVFVAWQNRFHLTTPVVVVELGYLAVVAIVFNMYRTGAAVVARNEEDDDGASWGMPIGARGELEREKRSLLKAIKEAEFDQLMGKLSKQDAEQMIGTIRARAIEVIKEIDRVDAGNAGTVRERIEREVKARVVIASAVDKRPGNVEKKLADDVNVAPASEKKTDKKEEPRSKKRGKYRAKAEAAKADAPEEKADDAAEAKADEVVEAKADGAAEAKADEVSEAKADDAAEAKADEVVEAKADDAVAAKADSTMNAKIDANTDAKTESKPDAKSDPGDVDDDTAARSSSKASDRKEVRS